MRTTPPSQPRTWCVPTHAATWSGKDCLALLVPIGLFAVLNCGALTSWWTHDDPCLLRSLIEHGIWAHLSEPQIWQYISATLLMPWVMVSFGVDQSLFGLNPTAFYAHQLLSFVILLVVAYVVLRRFLAPASASFALSMLAVSLPSFVVTQQLMNRTYVEGLTFALLGVALYQRSLDRREAAWSVAGAVAYALAATAKEVFVPLVAVLPFLPIGSARLRLWHWVPYALVASIYVVWRTVMLAGGLSLAPYGVFSGDSASFAQIAVSFGVPRLWGLPVVLLCVASVLVVGLAWPRRWFLLLASAAAVFVPLATLGSAFAPRHAFVPSFLCAALIATALQESQRIWPGTIWSGLNGVLALVLVAVLWSGATSADVRRYHPQEVQHYRAEGSFVLGDESGAVLSTTLNDLSYLTCMRDLRPPGESLSGPGFCGDVCFCARSFPGKDRWAYDGERVVRVDQPVDADCALDRAVEVDFRYDSKSGIIRWRAGPYTDGRYEALLIFDPIPPEVSIPIWIPRTGEMPFWLNEPLGVVVRYEDVAGWRVYSAPQELRP